VTLAVILFVGPHALASALPGRTSTFLSRASLVLGLAVILVVSGVFVTRYDEYVTVFQNFDRNRSFDR
jgi:hypothetical protein